MEDLKFKDVVDFHIGCLYEVTTGLFKGNVRILTNFSASGVKDDRHGGKPFLFPLSAMTGEQAKEYRSLIPISGNYSFVGKVSAKGNVLVEVYHDNGFTDSICKTEMIVQNNKPSSNPSPKQFLWLLRNHFNVFNLPESEYIDCTKLPVNPYSKS